ncbi:MAG: hypothetical protein ACI8T1_002264 [Verrucomicrobiales bacterium]|jgi:hypothetical protein
MRLQQSWRGLVWVRCQEDEVNEESENPKDADKIDRQLEIAGELGLRLLVFEDPIHRADAFTGRSGPCVRPPWREITSAT